MGHIAQKKSGNEMAIAIAKIIRDDGRCPKNLHTDRRNEFYNSAVQKFLKKYNINHHSMYSVMVSVVERFNRTLKNDMWKFIHNENYKWMDILPRLVSYYNGRKHQTIGMHPVDVIPIIADRLLITVYNPVKIAVLARYKVSDSVCVSKFKTVFDKGYTPNWSTEVFKIIKVQ